MLAVKIYFASRYYLGILTVKKNLSEDYNVSFAHSGEEAIEASKNLDPALAIVDHHMPGLNGIETIKRITEVDRKCKFILMSGLMDIDLFKSAEKLGVHYCFSKPFNLDEIKNAVKEIFSSR